MLSGCKLCQLLITLAVMSSVAFAQSPSSGKNQHNEEHLQSDQINYQPELKYPDYPILTLPDSYRGKQLPGIVDNSIYPFLRPVFEQQGASCGQSASIAYNFCYEINRKRNIPSNIPGNQYPSHFAWNFMNAGLYYGVGVSYFHSFEVLKTMGCPNEETFGPITLNNPYVWMSGYDKYYESMHNRISTVHSIPVGNPAGLETLKNWLNDHLEGSTFGGVANFYTGITSYFSLPESTPEAGKKVITDWYTEATHALTIIGYNDSIRFDLNSDGKYTNDIDINNDGKVDMQDWEIGGVKFVNSYGEFWADSGFCYTLYSTLAKPYGQGGIWNNAVHVIDVDSSYNPLLTIKAKIRHTTRGRIRIRAGISADTVSFYPSHIIEFPVFNYQGDDIYMQGGKTDNDKEIEIGLDISPLIGFTSKKAPSRVFLLIDEKDPEDKGNGLVEGFSVIRYDSLEREYVNTDTPYVIIDNDQTILKIDIPDAFTAPYIDPLSIPAASIGNPYHFQLTASSGLPPYKWDIKKSYNEIPLQQTFTPGNGEKLAVDLNVNEVACLLPFHFPFYRTSYDTVFVHKNGYLLLEAITAPYPYLQDENLYLKQIRAIAACMNNQQSIFTNSQGIWYYADSSKAIFTWKLGFSDNDSSGQTNFKIILFPDGQIDFIYGNCIFPQGLEPVKGISNGDGTNYQISPDEHIALLNVKYLPTPLPGSFQINETGLISTDTISQDLSGDFIARVTDFNHLSSEKKYTFSTGPFVSVSVQSGSDTIIESGEEARCELYVRNNSAKDLNDLQIKIHSYNSDVQVIDSITGLIQLPSGQEFRLTDAFRFFVSRFSEEEQVLNFRLSISWGSHSSYQFISFKAFHPGYRVSGPVVNDHDNNHLDQGEQTGILMRLTTLTKMPEGPCFGTLTCDDPYICLQDPQPLKFMSSGNSIFKEAEWKVAVNQSTPNGHISEFTFIAISANGDTVQEKFELSIGRPSILVIDMDKNNNSAGYISDAINKLGFATSFQQGIDTTIFNYQAIFLCLGVRQNNHALTAAEGQMLQNYLEAGGNLYMEGGSTFESDIHLPVHDMFRVVGTKVGWHYPADTLNGDTGTPANGISFVYLGEKLMASNLLPLSPAIPLFTDINSGLHFVIENDSVIYRTIASAIEFGGTYPLNNNYRTDIMKVYLDFFNLSKPTLAANFKTSANETCVNEPVMFTSLCAGNPTSYHWTFTGGNPSESDEPVVFVSWDSTGYHSVSLTVSDNISSNTLVKDKQVDVLECASINTIGLNTDFFIYPNPTSVNFNLVMDNFVTRKIKMEIKDLTGKSVFSSCFWATVGRSSYPCLINTLSPGIYFVTLSDNYSLSTMKLIIR